MTTEGFRDLLVIRRQERPALYDLEPRRQPHVVARGDVITVRERVGADGEVVTPLDGAEAARVVEQARAMGAEAVAICLLFSYLRPEHEARLAEALREAGFPVSASHEVLPEHREYERASTTAINAFLQPAVRHYLGGIDERFPGLRVMHSAGGLADAATASERPVSMVTSGPAGGVLGALAVAKAAGHEQIITFDMGGTSTDVSLCPGEPRYRSATEIDGLALHTPMVDIVTVGAGGGSIARLDAGGALAVGPQSAGADPAPPATAVEPSRRSPTRTSCWGASAPRRPSAEASSPTSTGRTRPWPRWANPTPRRPPSSRWRTRRWREPSAA